MDYPTCCAPLEIKETQSRKGLFYRRRICFTQQAFITREIIVTERQLAGFISDR